MEDSIHTIMDSVQIAEDNNVTFEIEIDEILKEFDGFIVEIIYKGKRIKKIKMIEEVIECED